MSIDKTGVMRFTKWFVIILLVFASIHSLHAQQKIRFLNPAYTENNAALQPSMEGVWHVDIPSDLHITNAGDNFYHVWYGDSLHPALYEAVFFEIT